MCTLAHGVENQHSVGGTFKITFCFGIDIFFEIYIFYHVLIRNAGHLILKKNKNPKQPMLAGISKVIYIYKYIRV